MKATVLLEYIAGEKSLRMSQISKPFAIYNYCVLARIMCIYSSNNLGVVVLFLRIDQPSQKKFAYV